MKPGARNLITDVAGLRVGNATLADAKTGVTVLTSDAPVLASVDVMGGAPGTRETDCLAPENLVADVDAIVLAGGSAFGLDAASGVIDALAENDRGFRVGPVTVPIVPAAIIFDLLNGGNKEWSQNPYNALGRQAWLDASTNFDLGTSGAGTGATTATLKGGLGSASVVLERGYTVGALVVVNPHGSVLAPGSNQFWAAPFEVDDEFGGLGVCTQPQPLFEPKNEKLAAYEAKANTTIGVDGLARSIVPSHTLYDGDLIFGVSTRNSPMPETSSTEIQMALGHAASLCMARAVARGVYLAEQSDNDTLPSWRSRYLSEQ